MRELKCLEISSTGQRKTLACVVGLLSLAAYGLTLYPSVAGGDSAELVTNAYRLGVSHPPGYPLYTLLAKLFTWVPSGSIAWRVNLFSAVCDSAAAVILFLTVSRWAKNAWAGLASAALFAFSPLVWHFAVRAEVFALNNLFISLLFHFAQIYFEKKEDRFAFAGALVAGLGLANHQTFLFYVLPCLVFVLALRPKGRPAGPFLGKIAALFLLGLTPYLYLPIAAAKASFGSWGEADQLRGFLVHVLRKEYGTFRLIAAENREGGFFHGLGYYLPALFKETLWIGPVLAAWGAWRRWMSERADAFLRLTLVCFGFYVVAFHFLANLDLADIVHQEIQSRFWQQANIPVFVWMGLAVSQIPRFAPVLSVALAVLQLGLHFQLQNQSRNRVVHDYAVAILTSLPANSLLLTEGDIQTFPMTYVTECEGYRPDVKILDRQLLAYPWMARNIRAKYPEVTLPGKKLDEKMGYSVKALFDANAGKFPIYMANPTDAEKKESWTGSYKPFKYGLISMIVPPGAKVKPDEYYQGVMKQFSSFAPAPKEPPVEFPWEYVIWKDYWESLYQQGFPLIDMGRENHDPRQIERAVAIWESLVGRLPRPQPAVFRNLGIAQFELIASNPAALPKSIEAFRKFMERASADDPDRQKVAEAIANLEKAQAARARSPDHQQ